MFTVVVTPPSSEPTSTASSQASSPHHSSAPFALSIQPDLPPMSVLPPLTNRAQIPNLTDEQLSAPAPAVLVTPAPGNEDVEGLSAAALAMARQADASKRLGHTARPPADPALAAAARANVQQPPSATAAPPAVPTSALSPATSPPSSPRQSMFGSSLSLAVIPPSPRSSLSTPAARPRPSPLSSILFQSRPPPPTSSPPSPRTLNSPSYRHPSRLFPSTVHTDKHGYLLPPVANADLPRTLEGKGDSFWIDEQTRQKKEEERLRRARRGRRGRKVEQAGEEESDRSEDADVEAGVIDVVRVEEDDDDELQWHEVIDVVLQVGSAVAKEKQRRLMERRRKGLHRKTPSTVTIEHIQDHNAE